MKNRIINLVLILIALAILAIFASTVHLDAAADSVVVLKTFGLPPGDCSERIIQSVEAERGVAAALVDVDTGRVAIAYDSGVVKPEVLAERVTAIGYGSSVLQILTPEEFQAQTGRTVASLIAARKSGCGGRCDKR